MHPGLKLKDLIVCFHFNSPWDTTIHETNEEVQLIVHMWIGLFYSRSTARFFQLETDFPLPCSDDNDILEGMDLSNEKRLEQTHSKTDFSSPPLTVTDNCDSQALDLSKPKNSTLDLGSGVLDLSAKFSSVHISTLNPEVCRKELKCKEKVNIVKPSGLQETTVTKVWMILLQLVFGDFKGL